VFVTYIYTSSGKLKDVRFYDKSNNEIKDLSEKIKEAFLESDFVIGWRNNQKISYHSWKVMQFDTV
jgi:hypothetical protein